ncbi:hypothetical protein Tco_0638545 [Tanacetum coccineum]
MYDVRLKNDCTISEAVKDGKWCLPEDWNNEFDSLQHLQVAVYFVWQERHKRMFGEEKRDSEELIKIVTESVRMKLMGFKVKDSRSVKEVERTYVKIQRIVKESV